MLTKEKALQILRKAFYNVDSQFNGNQYKSIGKLVNPRTHHIYTKSTIYGLTINK